jgi:transcriptional regulator with XRE-family HTH domain
MKTNNEKQKFIELRALGYSFDKIAAKMKVSRPTLTKWERENEFEIQNEAAMNYQAILEANFLSKIQKVEKHAVLLSKVMNEISKRDFTNVSLKDLIAVKDSLDAALNRELDGRLCLKEKNTFELDPEIQTLIGRTVDIE